MPRVLITKKPSAAAIAHDVLMKRTLLIGIGGSGKEVLVRFRLKMLETYGSLEEFNFIDYLWIDTDYNNRDINNREYSKALRTALLKDEHSVNASMEAGQLKQFYENYNQYENFHSWYNRSYLQEMGNQILQTGASAMRPFGKLAFWHNFAAIKDKLVQKIRRLQGPFEHPNLSTANDIDIYIVGSLAGGTGAGMFIDLAAFLQSYVFNSSRNGMFFLADVFEEIENLKVERESNCYAALQELDFYMTPDNMSIEQGNKNIFTFEWERGIPVSITLPILTRVNLISNAYENGESEQNMSDAFNLAAEYLFLGFNQSSFDNEVRSIRTNVIAGYNNKVHYIYTLDKEKRMHLPFQTCYTSIALGIVEFNRRKIRNWAKYRFLSEFCDEILTKDNMDSSSYLTTDGQLRSNLLEPDTLFDFLKTTDELSQLQIETNTAVRKLKDDIISNLPIELSLTDVSMKVKKIESDVESFFQEKKNFINKEARKDFNHTGIIVRSIERQYENVVNKLEGEIFSQIIDLLSDFNQLGYKACTDYINHLKSALRKLDDYIQNKENKIISFNYRHPEPINQTDYNELRNINSYLQEANEIPDYFLFYRKKAKNYYENKRHYARNRFRNSLVKAIEDYLDLHKTQIDGLLMNCIEKLAVKSYQKLSHDLGLFLASIENNELRDYQQTFKSLKSEYTEMMNSYPITKRADSQRKLVLEAYINDELQEEYKSFSNNQKQNSYQGLISYLYDEIPMELKDTLTDKRIVNSPHKLFSYIVLKKRILRDKYDIPLQKLIVQKATAIFDDFIASKNVENVLFDLLSDEDKKKDISDRFKQVWEHSCMRLMFDSNADIRMARNGQKFSIDGIPDNTSLQNELSKIIENRLNIRVSTYPEAIIFYREGSGFPVSNLIVTEKLRTSMRRELKTDIRLLYKRYTTRHYEYLDPNLCSFNDVEFKEHQEFYSRAMKAIILGKISYSDNGGSDEKRFTYSFSEHGIRQVRPLGKRIDSVASYIKTNLNNIDFFNKLDFNELPLDKCLVLHSVLRENIKPIRAKQDEEYNYLQGDDYSVCMDQFVLDSMLSQLEDTIRNNVKSEYDNEDKMNSYLTDVVHQYKLKENDYRKLEYYTSNFPNGLFVVK